MHSTGHSQASSGRGRMSFETPTSVRKSDAAQPRVASNVLPNANPDQRLDARPAVDDVSQPRPGVVAGQRLVDLPFLFLRLPCRSKESRSGRRGTRRGDPVVARGGTVQALGTGRDKPVPYNARAGSGHECGTGHRRGDACRRPWWDRASLRDGTGQARPLQRPRRERARMRHGTSSGRRLSSPVVGPCKPSGRDGTSPSPTTPAPGPGTKSARDIVGATLAVARGGTVHEFGTGRDKPVPYNARAGTGHEFGTGHRRGDACRRPWWDRAGIRDGTGRDKPVPTVFCACAPAPPAP